MNLKIYPFINQYVILSNFYGFLIASPIIGSNVRQANSDEFPSIVSLMYISEGIENVEELHFCTGALLTNTHVLTAAHCLEDTLKNETQIVIGSRDLRCGQIFYPLWWVDYNQWAVFQNVPLQFRVNDIAIIKLSQSVPNNITPLPLSTAKNIYLYGLNVVAAGWGISNNGEVTRIMETVNLRILSNADCEVRIASANGRRIPVHERLLCSISEPFAVMQAGESGCPILFAGVIIGIQKSTVPFPELTFHPLKVNVHTGVEYYNHFIMHILNSNQEWF